jgi:[protein]-arginine 3-hydroxylase / protease
MLEALKHVENPEVRDLIPKGLLRRWHVQYFFDTLFYNFFHNTRLCTSPQERFSPKTFENIITRSFKRKMDERLLELGKEGGPGKILELPRVRDISPQDLYQQYIFPNKPVVLEGAAKEWRCTREWTPEFFRQRYGKNPILVTDGKNWSMNGTLNQAYASLTPEDNNTVGDLIDDIERGGSKYATFYPFLSYHPELYDDLDIEYLATYFHMNKRLPWQKRFFPKLFLGGAGTSTTVHCAGIINLNVQIYGEKQWDVWSPDVSPFLYPTYEITNNSSIRVDFRNPDVSTFPLYQYADRYRTILKPGDIIFVPAWWWHGCYNLTTSISTSNLLVRFRSSIKNWAFGSLSLLDPWSIPAIVLQNKAAIQEWEKTLPKIVYQRRNSYFGQVAAFFRFVFSKIMEKLGLSRNPAPSDPTKLID